MFTGSQYFPVNPPFNSRRSLFVDPNAGPFFTLTQAKNAAQSGDCIVVMPGTYAENNLLKNGVNWFFMPGAVVSYTATAALAAGGGDTCPNDSTTTVYGIFDDRASGACTCTIGGAGSFYLNNRGFLLLKGTLVVTNVASRISFTGKEIGFSFFRDGPTEAQAGTRAAVYVTNGVRVDVTVERIYGTRGQSFDTGQLDTLSSHIFWADNGSGVYWQLGDLYICCNSIDTIASYSIWGDQPSGNATAANLYVQAHIIAQHMYMDGGATAGGAVGTYNWKSWIVCEELQEGPAYFDYGKHYLSAQKINLNTTLIAVQGATQLWITAQKITNAGGGGWLLMTVGNPSGTGAPVVYVDCQHFEDTQGAFNNAGIEMNSGELHVRGGFMKPTGPKPAILHAAGSSRITNLTIDTTAVNNANSQPVKVSAAGCILDKCVLKAPALADSVNSAAPQTITAYGCKANKAKNANVTVNVDAITVDANVV